MVSEVAPAETWDRTYPCSSCRSHARDWLSPKAVWRNSVPGSRLASAPPTKWCCYKSGAYRVRRTALNVHSEESLLQPNELHCSRPSLRRSLKLAKGCPNIAPKVVKD